MYPSSSGQWEHFMHGFSGDAPPHTSSLPSPLAAPPGQPKQKTGQPRILKSVSVHLPSLTHSLGSVSIRPLFLFSHWLFTQLQSVHLFLSSLSFSPFLFAQRTPSSHHFTSFYLSIFLYLVWYRLIWIYKLYRLVYRLVSRSVS